MINFSLESGFEKWIINHKDYLHARNDIKISSVFEKLSSDQREKGVLNFEHNLLIMQIEAWGHGYIDASLLETKHKSLHVYHRNFATEKEFINYISTFWKVMLQNIDNAELKRRIERAELARSLVEAELINKKKGPKN